MIMSCEYCYNLERTRKRERLNLGSAVLVERAKNFCVKWEKGVFMPNMAGCKEGVIDHQYLDNFHYPLGKSLDNGGEHQHGEFHTSPFHPLTPRENVADAYLRRVQ